MGKYFGTDGFRGEANKNLTADHAYRIGRFLGWYFGEQKRRDGQPDDVRIVIGKDTRRSSYMFEFSLVAGLIASGADAYLLHVTTTPSVSYICRVDSFDCGIMISASHNPYQDNGIKLLNGHGEKMDETTISLVEAYLDGAVEVFGRTWVEIPFALRDKIGRTVDYTSGRNRYMGYLISLGMYSFKGKTVALDCANGAAFEEAKAVFEALGAKTLVINAEPNGLNINENAGSTHLEGLQRFVVEHQCDVGFAYDGDADRCLAVDENGHLVDGDQIIYLCGRYLSKYGRLVKDTVVPTVMSNYGLFKALDEIGIKYETTDVGDRFVYACMRENGYSLGGEQSGHIIFGDLETTGDGIMTSLRVMEVVRTERETLSTLCRPVKLYPQRLDNVRVTDRDGAMSDPAVLEAAKKADEFLGGNGRVFVRASGTEPLVRVLAEAPEDALCREANDIVLKVLEKFRAK